MFKSIVASAVLGLSAVGSLAASASAQPCYDIRTEISKIVGLDVTPNKELLQTIGTRSDCEFTSEEVYRVIAGDKPKSPPEVRSRHQSNNLDEDD